MKKMQSPVFVLAVTLTLFAFGMAAVAADAPAQSADKCAAEKKCPAEKEEATHDKAPEGPKCTVKGTIEAKTEKNKQGKEVKVYSIKVSEAKDADGKAMDSLKGKVLRIAGMPPKVAQQKVGKEVQLKGIVVKEKRIAVERGKNGKAKRAHAKH